MFGLGTGELLVIFAIFLLVFGASRLPELGKGLGEGLRSFKEAMRAPESLTDSTPKKKAEDEKNRDV